MVQMMVVAPEGSSLAYLNRYLQQIEEIATDEVTRGNARRVLARSGAFGGNDVNIGRVMLLFNPRDEREESASQGRDREHDVARRDRGHARPGERCGRWPRLA